MDESGTAALEGALVIPLAIALMAGSVEFGQIYLDYGMADKTVRDAARYLAQVPPQYVCVWGIDKTKSLVVSASMSSVGSPTVTVVSPTCNAGVPSGSIVDVQATFPYNGSMLSVVGLNNALNLSVEHQEPYIGD